MLERALTLVHVYLKSYQTGPASKTKLLMKFLRRGVHNILGFMGRGELFNLRQFGVYLSGAFYLQTLYL